jgi:hypothetical protein
VKAAWERRHQAKEDEDKARSQELDAIAEEHQAEEREEASKKEYD